MGGLGNFLVFFRSEKLRNVFHQEYLGTGVPDNLEIRPPKLFPGIIVALLI